MCNRPRLLIALTCIAVTFTATEQWKGDNNQSETRIGTGLAHSTGTRQPGLYNVAQYIGALSKRTPLAPIKKSAEKKPKKKGKKKEPKKEVEDRDLDRELNMVETFDKNGRSLASQFLLRQPRERRPYDVPRIDCPSDGDGLERFACPSDINGRFLCLDDHVLCDGFYDCPGGEDEDRQSCMFYKTMRAHLDVVADALLRWVRG